MTGLGIAAIVLSAVWMGVLTLTILLLIRQVGVMTIRLDRLASGQGPSAPSDGLPIGEEIPESVVSAIPRLSTGTYYVVTLSASCTTCRQLAAELGNVDFPYSANVIALVPGAEDSAVQVAEALPADVEVVMDPGATEIANHLRIEYAPFTLEIEDRRVGGKAHLHRAADFVGLMRRNVLDDGELTSVRLPFAAREVRDHAH
jgi:hypothetical protein